MFRKIKLALILTAVSLSACGYDYDWMKGEFEGETKLFGQNNYGSSPELIRTGRGGLNFSAPFYARLGSNTPLPDCNLKFVSEKDPFKYSPDINGTDYRGHLNDGKGCSAYLFEGEPVPIEINIAAMRYEKDRGEMVMNIKFNIRNDFSRTYELEYRGRKKGWLW